MHFRIRKGVDKHKPYLLAEVLETVELFTELYAVTCFGTRATTALSGTCGQKKSKIIVHNISLKNKYDVFSALMFA